MTSYKVIIDLASDVEDRFKKTNGGRGEDFLPYDQFDKLVTRDVVESALKNAEVPDWRDLVEFVIEDAKRLFLILVMMTSRKDEKLSLLRDLQSHGISDEDLPIGFIKQDNRKYYGYSIEKHHDEKHFDVFDGWERNERELFNSNQWQFTSPRFDSTKFRHHFNTKRILPFMQVAAKPHSSGFFGEVSRIEVHPAHFLPKLDVVCNLTLLLFLTQVELRESRILGQEML
jgi:hypothetical protein